MASANQNKWGVVIVACLAIFIIVLDTSAMNVAITTLVVELNTTLSNYSGYHSFICLDYCFIHVIGG